LEPLPSPRTVGVPTLASSAVLVFDFRGDHTVRDEHGALLGSCKIERVDLWQAEQLGYVCRDHTETVAWMVAMVEAYLESSWYAVFGPDRVCIGGVDRSYLYLDVEPFAEMGRYGIRDLQGREIARTLPLRERFLSRRRVEVRYTTSLEGPRRDIVAATACVREWEDTAD